MLSAHRYDAGVQSISNTARKRKYDSKEIDTSIQPNIDAQLDYSLNGSFSRDYERRFENRHGAIDKGFSFATGYNDIGVANPKVSGFYWDKAMVEKAPINIFEKYPDVPIYIRENNQVKEFVWRDGKMELVNLPGKIERNNPEHALSDYKWPTGDHAKFANNIEERIEMEKEQGDSHFEVRSLGEIMNGTTGFPNGMDTRGWSYSRFVGEFLSSKLKSFAIQEDAIVSAASEDFHNSTRDMNNYFRETKLKAARENNPRLLGEGSTFKDMKEKSLPRMMHGFLGFIESLEEGGNVGLRQKLRKILESKDL